VTPVGIYIYVHNLTADFIVIELGKTDEQSIAQNFKGIHSIMESAGVRLYHILT
jgi:hypothetical protein